MTTRQKALAWTGGVAGAVLLLWLLRDVMLPFVAGMAVAYFLDPVADRFERAGLSRALATTLITSVFFAAIALIVVLLAPVIYAQAIGFAGRLPTYIASLREALAPLIERLAADVDFGQAKDGAALLRDYGERALGALGAILRGMLGGGIALLHVLSFFVITPVVAFYLLRDWDALVSRVDDWLPRAQAETIRARAREIDSVLAGFVRGQATVCLALAFYYGLGLSLVGLDFGLAIGMMTGFLAFIPYVGAALGFAAGFAVALVEFWPNWPWIAAVIGVFVLGQALEGYVLTPRLVGSRVGLHPLWIIFGLMAGASLFGFVGVLIAVPAFAVVGVLARFGLARYLASPLYRATPPPPAAPPGARQS